MDILMIIMIAGSLSSIISIVIISLFASKMNEFQQSITTTFTASQEKFNNEVINIIKTFLDNVKKIDENRMKMQEIYAKQNEAINYNYSTITTILAEMNSRYEEINNNYTNLLHAWGQIEERYSDLYEQIDNLHKHFTVLIEVMKPKKPNKKTKPKTEDPPENETDILDPMYHQVVLCDYDVKGICTNEDSQCLNDECLFLNAKACRYSKIKGAITYGNDI